MTDHARAWVDRIARLVERLGVATVILGFVGYGIWTIANRTLDEAVIPVARNHMEVVTKLSRTMDEVNHTLKSMDSRADDNATLLLDTHAKVEQIHAKVVSGTK